MAKSREVAEMTLEELRKLVADGEGDHVEFKESTGQRIEACRTPYDLVTRR